MNMDKPNLNTVYLVLDGTNIANKGQFLSAIGNLLKFPDYYGHNWDALDECLGDIVSIWEQENPTFISPFINVIDAIDKELTVNVIWIKSEIMFNNNADEFFIAVDILKQANTDKSTPLNFYLANYMGDNKK